MCAPISHYQQTHTHTLAGTHLALHRIGVQLAHVTAPVVLRHRLHVQIPCVLVGMGDGYARIVRDDVLVNGLDGFGVRLHPADLQNGLVLF